MLGSLIQKSWNFAASLIAEDIQVSKKDLLPLLGGTFQKEKFDFRKNQDGLYQFGTALQKLTGRIDTEAKKSGIDVYPFTKAVKEIAFSIIEHSATTFAGNDTVPVSTHSLARAMENRVLVQNLILDMMHSARQDKLMQLPMVEAANLVYGLKRLSSSHTGAVVNTDLDDKVAKITPYRKEPYYDMVKCMQNGFDALRMADEKEQRSNLQSQKLQA